MNETLPTATAPALRDILMPGMEECAQPLEGLLYLAEWSEDLVMLTNAQGDIIYTNDAVERVTGFSREEVLGSRARVWGYELDSAQQEAIWVRVTTERKQHQATVRNKHKDGRVYDAEVRVVPLVGANGSVKHCLVMERNVSDARQLERAKREFIALASHNLKTPLASMRWYAEMLLDGDAGSLKQDQREYIEEVLQGAKRMNDLIHTWLSITSIDLGTYTCEEKRVAVETVVERTVEELAARAQSMQVTVTHTPPVSPCVIIADEEVLHTIVHALLKNAVKYNRVGGSVSIELKQCAVGDECGGRVFTSEQVLLAVHDTGIGVPIDEQGMVFQQFFRGSNVEQQQSQGAGLGLFYARELARLCGGTMWFSSSEEGSDFYLALPTPNKKTRS